MNNNSNYNGLFAKLIEKANERMDKVNGTVNGEPAKKIRKKLLTWGGVGAGLGIAMIIAGFITFAVGGFKSVETMKTSVTTIIGPVIFILGGLLMTFGIAAIRAGLAIVITGVATKSLDVNKYCPHCGDIIDEDELCCNKCGANLRENKICECGTQNDVDDEYCRKCGKKLK